MPSCLLAGADRTAFTVPISLARMAGDRRSIGRLLRPYPNVATTPALSASNKGTLDAEMVCSPQNASHRSRSAVMTLCPTPVLADHDAGGCAEGKQPRTRHQSFRSRTLAGWCAPLA